MSINHAGKKSHGSPKRAAHLTRLRKEIIWKEAIMLTLITIFSFMFYSYRIETVGIYLSFLVGSGALYYVASAEEKAKRKKKMFDDYFFHNSSYFAIAFMFFLGSLIMVRYELPLLGLAVAIGIIMFSAGLMHLIFERMEYE